MANDPWKVVQRWLSAKLRPARLRVSSEGGPLRRLPATHIEAAKQMVDFKAIVSPAFLARAATVSTVGMHPDIERFARRLCKELQVRGWPFFLVEGFRSHQRQAELLRLGVTQAEPGKSAHNWGMAADVIHFKRGWNLTRKEWALVGAVGKDLARRMGLKVTWGGDWSFYDPAHWDLAEWRKLI